MLNLNLPAPGKVGIGLTLLAASGLATTPLYAQTLISAQAVKEYGNENLMGAGTYSSDPKAGATEYGLAPSVITDATNFYGHGFPFSPGTGDYPGTDQIYVGSVQTASHDGYSQYSGRIHGPQVISLDYNSLLPSGQQVHTFTLGIAADDFQFRSFGQPFTASLNGVVNTALTNKLNSLNETGPLTHFFTVGVDPSLLTRDDVLKLSINEGGDGGDGWGVDFLTVGITSSSPAPEPSEMATLSLCILGMGGLAIARRRKASASDK